MTTRDPARVDLDATVFRVPRSLRVTMLALCALLSTAAIYWGTQCLLPAHDLFGPKLLLTPGAVCLAWLAYQSAQRLCYQVVVNAEGVSFEPRTGTPDFLAWREMTRIVADDTGQRLILYGATSDRRIRLDYQLENFARLRDLVLKNAAVPTPPRAEVGQIFHRTWINKVIFLAFTALSACFAYRSAVAGQAVPALFLCGVAAFFLLAVLTRDPTHVVIERNGVLIRYLCRTQTIPWNTITAILLKDMPGRGNVWAAVVIERQRGRPLQLFRSREGSLALHDALQGAWLARRERS